MNDDAFRNRIIEVELYAHDEDGNFSIPWFENNANFF